MLIAQTIHAAGESVREPIPPETRACALAVSDEAALRALSARLYEAGVDHTLIEEPDAPWNGAAMALGIRPTPKTPALKKLLSQLPLLK